MTPIADVARGKWRSILPQLGVAAEHLTGKHGPCPVPSCGGKDRFRFTDFQRSGGFVCNACGKGDGVKLLCLVHGWSFADCAAAIREIADDLPAEETPRRAKSDERNGSRRLWEASTAITPGDAAGAYLSARGFTGPYGGDLRYLRNCAVTGIVGTSSLPAMLALVRDPSGAAVLVHRTYLGIGAKAAIESPRRMMAGTIPPGSAIRLAPYSRRLGVAEGIETALAVTRDRGIPCWAASNAQMLAAFVWPEDVDHLDIFADNDRKFGGQAAAYALAHRVATHRRAPRVEVHVPAAAGEDWWDSGERERLAHAAQ